MGGEAPRKTESVALRAPIYVRAHDLARAILETTSGWTGPVEAPLASALRDAVLDIVRRSALALAFPDRRDFHRTKADEAVMSARVLLRLARDTNRLSPRQLRWFGGELDVLGRMIGGWRRAARRFERRRARRAAIKGAGPSSAPRVSCAAAASGTTPGGVAPPTATGGGPANATTTSASASSSPPPPNPWPF